MDVVSDGEAVARGGSALGLVEDALEVVLGDLDVGELVVVIRVEVEVRDDVAESLQHVLAGSVAGRVGRAHVGRVLSDDVADGHLVLDHLVVSLSIGDDTEILVRPGVAGYLVALGDHSLDDVGPLRGGVDGALADIDTGDEKSGLESVLSELV